MESVCEFELGMARKAEVEFIYMKLEGVLERM